jgi:hypothetical protein
MLLEGIDDGINQGNGHMPVHCQLFFIACLYGTSLGEILYNFHRPVKLGIDELARVHRFTYPEHTLLMLVGERIQVRVGGVREDVWTRAGRRGSPSSLGAPLQASCRCFRFRTARTPVGMTVDFKLKPWHAQLARLRSRNSV